MQEYRTKMCSKCFKVNIKRFLYPSLGQVIMYILRYCIKTKEAKNKKEKKKKKEIKTNKETQRKGNVPKKSILSLLVSCLLKKQEANNLKIAPVWSPVFDTAGVRLKRNTKIYY